MLTPLSTAPRWAVELRGHQFDLDDGRSLFAEGTTRVVYIGINRDMPLTALVSDEFEKLDNSKDVLDDAKRLVELVNGLLFLHEPKRETLSLGNVFERFNDGWRSHAIVEVQAGKLRMKGGSIRALVNGVPLPEPLLPHSAWLQNAGTDDLIADVLTYLRKYPDWFELYKAFERMRDDISRAVGQHNQEQIGWPDKGTLDKFTESAQVHRHSPARRGRYTISTAPMTLEGARPFIRDLALKWLAWRCARDASQT